jgi:hypothetical protein
MEAMRKPLWALLSANLLLVSACADDRRPDPAPIDPGIVDPAAPREREIRGGRLHDTALPGVSDAGLMDAAPLITAVQADLRGRLGALRSGDFIELDRSVTRAGGGARLAHVTLRQSVDGIPVEETYLHVAVRYGGTGGTKIVNSSYRLFENVQVDTRPAVPHDRALRLARQSLRLPAGAAPSEDELVLRQLDGRLQLAWKLAFPDAHERAFVIASGPERGRVHRIDARIFETTGTVSGAFVHGGAPGGLGTVVDGPLPHIDIHGVSASTQADAAGAYAIEVPDGEELTVGLTGRAALVATFAGAPLGVAGFASDGGVTDLHLEASDEAALAQVTAYYFTDGVRSFLEANGVDSAVLGAPLQTNTNLNDVCNAFYSPAGRSINFFRSGGGCNNSATDSIVAHEYGHFVDHMLGGITNGGLSEGWGDLISCLYLGIPEVGFDLLPGAALRSCDNTYQYPPGGLDGVHNLGQAWAGFGWDVRQGLIAQLGEAAGEALARELLLPALVSNAPDIPSAVRETFLRDDDDGDLDNQTPHWDVLYQAALNHSLTFAIELDDEAPAAVSDLAVVDAAATQVTLRWTATGDDGHDGTANSYELRWATFPIDESNFSAATLAPTGAPLPAGSLETAIVAVPPDTTVWFALVVRDEQLNTSPLSNVVSVTTPPGTIVYEEDVEGDTDGWTATGLWHVTSRRASQGSQSFWYGIEATGNYDTGAANSGTLISPIIDLSGAVGPVLVFDQLVDVEADPWDQIIIAVVNVDDTDEVVYFGKDTHFTGGAFVSRVLPLEGFAGDRVQIYFHLDTIDEAFNTTEGWYVDNIRVLGSEACAHGLCFVGGPLDPECDECVADVCAADPFCCEFGWDEFCVATAQELCGLTCSTCGNGACEPGETPETCPQDCPPASCAHGVCEPGVALDPGCDTCVAAVCEVDDFCCTVFWDRVCVQEAEALCGVSCQGCAHDACAVGEPLAADCDPCVQQVCDGDPYCCTTAWDSRCVFEATAICGLACETCPHDPCTAGTPLPATCDPCVTAVCAADPFCCNVTWDDRCVQQAQEVCGLSCANAR